MEKGTFGKSLLIWHISGLFGGDKRDRTADLLNAIFGKEMESVGIWWNLEKSSAI